MNLIDQQVNISSSSILIL